MKAQDAIRLFGLNNLVIESEIRGVFDNMSLGPRRKKNNDSDSHYYPQFTERLRLESELMAKHYAIFYCLENTIRNMLRQRLSEVHGDDWWNASNVIPANVAKNCLDNRKREIESGITPRSEDLIDYSSFGELGEIIRNNWDLFGDTLRDRGAVNRILSSLNTLRAPIAHCKILAEDEILRLHLAMRDWFRQMG